VVRGSLFYLKRTTLFVHYIIKLSHDIISLSGNVAYKTTELRLAWSIPKVELHFFVSYCIKKKVIFEFFSVSIINFFLSAIQTFLFCRYNSTFFATVVGGNRERNRERERKRKKEC